MAATSRLSSSRPPADLPLNARRRHPWGMTAACQVFQVATAVSEMRAELIERSKHQRTEIGCAMKSCD
jgi:hypothetical protein